MWRDLPSTNEKCQAFLCWKFGRGGWSNAALLLLISCGCGECRKSRMERHRERREEPRCDFTCWKSSCVCSQPFQKIMHASQVAAAMDGREAAFPGKEENPSRKPTCCNFWLLLLLFLLVFGFLSLRGGCDCSQFLAVLCPRAKWSTDGEWAGTRHHHSQQRGREVKELHRLTSPWASHLLQTGALLGKHGSVANNIVRDEGEGNGGFICGTPERWSREVEVLLWKQRTAFTRRSWTEWQVGADYLGGKNPNTLFGISHLNWCENTQTDMAVMSIIQHKVRNF